MSVAGAYWKGQEGNPQMQRIYGACFYTQKGARRISAQARRSQAPRSPETRQELDLFSIQDEAGPGLIFWHPKGGLIRKLMEDWLREELLKPRLRSRVHAAHHAPRSVEDQRPRQFLSREYVRPVEVEKPTISSSP
jgi:threonyl-tRNA synthetase